MNEGGENRRVAGIDLARALAIVFMIMSHVQLFFRLHVYVDAETGDYSTFLDRLTDSFLAADMAAPVFMFVMGMCMLYSRRSEAGDWARRGVKLLLQALLLSAAIKSGLVFGYRWLMLTPAEVPDDTWVRDFLLDGDILNFAGFAFLVFALMKLLRFGPRAMLALAGALYAVYVAVATTVGTDAIPWPLGAVVGWICGTDHMSFFPLFTWLVYPVAGYVMADLLRKSADPDRLLRRAGLAGLAVFVLAFAVSWPYSFEGFPLVERYGGAEFAYYHQHPVCLLRCFGLVLFELWVCELVARRLPDAVMKHFRRWSVNVNAMYLVSWALIVFAGEFLLRERRDMPVYGWLAGAAVVFAITDLGVSGWKRFRGRRHE